MPQHEIGFLVFPNLTQLDFTGPLQVLSRLPGARTHIVAKSPEPIPTDCGLSLLPTVTLEDCPKLDLLCVPGGFGVVDVMKDDTSLDFVRRQAASARYVTSVCVGAFVLGAAGLLRGKRATTHWAYTDLLPLVGATYEKARVVRDGNLITAGGVTAGIDFGLVLVAEIAGREAAETVQLSIEYDPAPPFDAGHPDRAPTPVRTALVDRYAKSVQAYRDAIALVRLAA
jgi:cyclohexyl-isocyanide hydratase